MTLAISEIARIERSAQRALLGNITANLAAAFVSVNGRTICLAAYFFEDANALDREFVEEAATEIIADFPDANNIETRVGKLSDVKLNTMPNCVFLRAEALTPEKFSKARRNDEAE